GLHTVGSRVDASLYATAPTESPRGYPRGRVQLQPLVEPQVVHFMHVPLRTRVKLPHSVHASPSKPLSRASRTRSSLSGTAWAVAALRTTAPPPEAAKATV